MCYGLGPQRGHARSFVAQALRADWTGYGGPFHRQTVYVNRISLYQLGSVESDSELLVSDEEIRGSDETSFARKAPNPAQRGTILPIAEAEVSVDWIENRTLNYPVGIATVEECTGELFDLEAFRDGNQFLYLGAGDVPGCRAKRSRRSHPSHLVCPRPSRRPTRPRRVLTVAVGSSTTTPSVSETVRTTVSRRPASVTTAVWRPTSRRTA